MTRITDHLHKNVFSVIMDILEMDHFREPEVEEVQLFLESTGTHGSIVNESARGDGLQYIPQNPGEAECTSQFR